MRKVMLFGLAGGDSFDSSGSAGDGGGKGS